MSAGRKTAIPVYRQVLYALLPAAVFFLALEMGLRLAGFEFHGIPTHVRFGPNVTSGFERNVIQPDSALFWRLRVGDDTAALLARKRAYHPDLEEGRAVAGMEGGTLRVVAMGDSCTFFGEPAYPRRLGQLLEEKLPGAEVLNAGVPGYSSYQGRRWFEEEIAASRPDWVTLYYGWNDHWRALQEPDHLVARGRAGSASSLASRLSSLRLFQAGTALKARLGTPPVEERSLRVPPDRYRDNLLSLCRAAGDGGAKVVMITAPAALTPPVLENLHRRGYVARAEEVAGRHERYNGIVREAARECGAFLEDFASSADRERHLSGDGIHLTAEGVEWLASRLAEIIAGGERAPADSGEL